MVVALVGGRVGDGGQALTPVQAQQLALARLLLADPPVAVLDEATAEAGSAGARTLERALDAALEGRSALVVAHRLTQAARADRIVVLEATPGRRRGPPPGPHRGGWPLCRAVARVVGGAAGLSPAP